MGAVGTSSLQTELTTELLQSRRHRTSQQALHDLPETLRLRSHGWDINTTETYSPTVLGQQGPCLPNGSMVASSPLLPPPPPLQFQAVLVRVTIVHEPQVCEDSMCSRVCSAHPTPASRSPGLPLIPLSVSPPHLSHPGL